LRARTGDGRIFRAEDQRAFKDWCIAHGVPHFVVLTTDEALAVLSNWGVLRIRVAANARKLLGEDV
jgi:hypothetical protein